MSVYVYIYLTCLAGTVAVSFTWLSAAGVGSDWLARTVVSDWTVYCCWVISVVLVTHSDEEEEVTEELCSGVDSVLDDVEENSCVTVSVSDDWLTVSLEAASFCGHGGIRVVFIAGDRGGLTGSLMSAVAESLRLCCESGMMAGSTTAV